MRSVLCLAVAPNVASGARFGKRDEHAAANMPRADDAHRDPDRQSAGRTTAGRIRFVIGVPPFRRKTLPVTPAKGRGISDRAGDKALPEQRTVVELREESRRCREEAVRTADPAIKLMLARRALEFAQLAETAERDTAPVPVAGIEARAGAGKPRPAPDRRAKVGAEDRNSR